MPKHLLIIDDDALLVRSLAYTLEQNGEILRLPVPLTVNELALGALVVACTLALALVGSRHGLFSRSTA